MKVVYIIRSKKEKVTMKIEKKSIMYKFFLGKNNGVQDETEIRK